jgi:pyridoxal biosynthesis lyase PdxS
MFTGQQEQDVVDEREQVVAAAVDMRGKFALGVRVATVAGSQQLGQADDRVQRGAQFVRHVGGEFGFVVSLLLQQEVRIAQLRVERLESRALACSRSAARCRSSACAVLRRA